MPHTVSVQWRRCRVARCGGQTEILSYLLLEVPLDLGVMVRRLFKILCASRGSVLDDRVVERLVYASDVVAIGADRLHRLLEAVVGGVGVGWHLVLLYVQIRACMQRGH